MKRAIYLAVVAALFAAAAIGTPQRAAAQENYAWTNQNGLTHVVRINWKPDPVTPYRRYTVGVSFLPLFNHGLKFDFEAELKGRPGEWLQASLIGYFAPERERRVNRYYYGYRPYGNNRSTFNSGFDYYSRMWGAGTSLLFKKMLHRRGWYFSTGLKFEYYRVEAYRDGMLPFVEDGLTFWESGVATYAQSYFKPSLQFNFGKHFTLSRRCFFDAWVGLEYSYSIFDNEKAAQKYPGRLDEYYGTFFIGMYGFGYRGLAPNAGFRFGVLLWGRDGD